VYPDPNLWWKETAKRFPFIAAVAKNGSSGDVGFSEQKYFKTLGWTVGNNCQLDLYFFS